jgi:HD-like signal output (HDOD) protein/ActR/RegA family two-component response regulator
MRRILFVDDDPPTLQALQLRLRPLRDKWEMAFVDSGARALAELQRAARDVIVSDMRMPGMDGAELLRTVSERWPQMVRIVLSGFSDQQQTIRLVPVAHQYLSKPCEPERLEKTVERCFALQELLQDERLRALIGGIHRLPTLPTTFARLQAVMARESSGARDVATVVAEDSVITAKVLQMVNSAFFRLSRRISNIEQAVNYLGFVTVRNLVMSAEVFARWPKREGRAVLDIERLQEHARRVAVVAQALTTGTALADDALLAALLHDIGYWVLLQGCPEELERAVAVAVAKSIPLHEAEAEVIGATHAEIGAYLLGIWGLPYSVVEAVAHHHRPQRVGQSGFDVLGALALASAFVPGDETCALNAAVPADWKVGPEYLASLAAPLSWADAERRATECLNSGEST